MKRIKSFLLMFTLFFPVMSVSHEKGSDWGLNIGAVYVQEERVFVPGMHIHYSKGTGGSLSVGAGFEIIFDRHKHYTASLLIGYEIYDNFEISYSPGISLLEEEKGNVVLLSHHMELSYTLNLGYLHLGPAVGAGFEGNIIHYMVGIHIGF